MCTYEPGRLRSPRAEACIAAAGPAVTLACALVLGWVAIQPDSDALILDAGAASAVAMLVLTAVPMRYGQGLRDLGGESDGRVVWRILTGAPPGGLAREEARLGRPERAVSPLAGVALAGFIALAAYLDPLLALALVGLVGLAYLLQRSEG
jgi:hypothetical protein